MNTSVHISILARIHWSCSTPLFSATLLILGPKQDSFWKSCWYPVLLIHPKSINRASSTLLPRRGRASTFLSAVAGKGEGQLPRLPQVTGQEGRASFPYPHHHMADERGSTPSPMLIIKQVNRHACNIKDSDTFIVCSSTSLRIRSVSYSDKEIQRCYRPFCCTHNPNYRSVDYHFLQANCGSRCLAQSKLHVLHRHFYCCTHLLSVQLVQSI